MHFDWGEDFSIMLLPMCRYLIEVKYTLIEVKIVPSYCHLCAVILLSWSFIHSVPLSYWGEVLPISSSPLTFKPSYDWWGGSFQIRFATNQPSFFNGKAIDWTNVLHPTKPSKLKYGAHRIVVDMIYSGTSSIHTLSQDKTKLNLACRKYIMWMIHCTNMYRVSQKID